MPVLRSVVSRTVVRGTLAAATFIFAALSPAGAQDAPADLGAGLSLGVWSAVAHDQSLATRIGYTHDRDLYLLGVRLTKPLKEVGLLQIDYAADLLPVVRSTNMPYYERYTLPRVTCAGLPTTAQRELCRDGYRMAPSTVSGYGIIPLGLQFRVAPQRLISLSARTSVGVVAFSRAIPDPRARRANFTLDAGAGIDVKLPWQMTASTSLRLNHISNAHTAELNPGMNTAMIEAGISYRGIARRGSSSVATRQARHAVLDVATEAPTSTLTAWSAMGRDEPLKTRTGHRDDRDLYIAGLRWSRTLQGNQRVRLDYMADLLPVVISTEMPIYERIATSSAICPANTMCLENTYAYGSLLGTRTVFGVGATPLGLQLRTVATNRIEIVARTSAGLIQFSRRIPDPEERRLNYTLDAGLGLTTRLSSGTSLDVGFRLNHISNGGRGAVNPGMNSRMLEVGISRTR
jgi:hypothetical protein